MLEKTERGLMKDTIGLLEAENMKKPTGLKKEWFDKSVSRNLQKVQKLCGEISITVMELNAALEAYGFQPVGEHPMDRKRTLKMEEPEAWVPTDFSFCYKHKSWKKVKDAFCHPSLCITFDLRPAWEGVRVSLWWESSEKEYIDEIRRKLRQKRNRGIELDEEYLGNQHELDVGLGLALDELDDGEKLLSTLRNALNRMRGFAENLDTLRGDLGIRS
jgi:hypothetical protein